QGKRVTRISGVTTPQVWAKPLSGVNAWAVALLNRSTQAVDMTVNWGDIHLPPGPAAVRDLWERVDRGVFNDSYTAQDVPAHGVVLIKIISIGDASPGDVSPTAA